jgi:DNA-binding transcriptional regulator YiaG
MDIKPSIKIKFIFNPHLKEYHSIDVDFLEFGEEKEVPASVAEYLLKVHSDKFELVDNKSEFVDSKREVGRPATKQMEIEQRFGKSLTEILHDNSHLSVRDLAKKLNVGKSTISKWRILKI